MPEYVGDDLVADMEAVWAVAAKSFPAMAEAYHLANRVVHLTSEVIPDGDGTVFMVPWRSLRDHLTMILGTSSRNIEDTATALREAMNDYADRDEEARDALNQALEELPGYVAALPPTRVPRQWLEPYSDQSHHPVEPAYLDAMYDGTAPTVEDLLEKARLVDEKHYDANAKEHPVLDLFTSDRFLKDLYDDELVSIEELMQQTVRCNPSWYEYGVTALRSITDFDADDKPFGRFRTEVANAKDALHPDVWSSVAAENFRSGFLNAYEDIAETQGMLLGELLGALVGYQRALEDTYRKYDEAMDAAIGAFQAIIDGGAAALVNVVTAVLTAAVEVGAVVATGGGATAMRFALAGSGISIGSASAAVGGDESVKVSRSLHEAIGAIKGTLEDFDQELARALESDLSEVTEARFSDGVIVLPRPAFANDHTLF